MKVVYSGPVKTGDQQFDDPNNSDDVFKSNSNWVLMCQTATFTGSQAWTVYEGATAESNTKYHDLGITIPAKAQICRIDIFIMDTFGGGAGADEINVGILIPDGTAGYSEATDINWFGKWSASGNEHGLAPGNTNPVPGRWANVGWRGAGLTDWPVADTDVSVVCNYYNIGATDATADWASGSTTISVDSVPAAMNVGAPLRSADGGIPVNATVASEVTGATSFTISEPTTTTGSNETINYSDAIQGQAMINVYYLQERNAQPTS